MTTNSTRTTPVVGQTAELSRTVGDNDIALFTEISGDRNPLHYDEAAARASRFGEIVVQGGITSAILNAVVAEELPGPGTVFLNVNWAFKAPVRPGDTITGRVEVTRRAPTSRSPNSRPPSPATTAPSSWTEQRCATRWISGSDPLYVHAHGVLPQRRDSGPLVSSATCGEAAPTCTGPGGDLTAPPLGSPPVEKGRLGLTIVSEIRPIEDFTPRVELS